MNSLYASVSYKTYTEVYTKLLQLSDTIWKLHVDCVLIEDIYRKVQPQGPNGASLLSRLSFHVHYLLMHLNSLLSMPETT